MKQLIFSPFILLIILFLSLSCTDDISDVSENNVSRTVIVYMIADNDLSNDALLNIKQMENGYVETGAKLIVFIDPANESPSLLQIEKNGSQIIKNYSEFNTVDANEFGKVFQEIITMSPSKEYDLVLWSHGSNWMPANSILRSFGYKAGKEINIPDLANALPIKFGFILFDACMMGSIEVAYELKDKSNYIIASSTEVLSDGFPYNEIVPEMLQPTVNLKSIAQKYFNYYNTQKDEEYRSATVTLINTNQLNDLAQETKRILDANQFDLKSFDRDSVQRLDTYDEQYVFDLLNFMDTAFPKVENVQLNLILNKTILYKSSTPKFLSMYEIKDYCGLSCYIPLSTRNDLNTYYKKLKWYNKSGFCNLF